MPWPSCFLGFPLPPLPCLARLSTQLAPPSTQQGWALKATRESAAILLLSVLIGIGESLFSSLVSPTHAGFQVRRKQKEIPLVA